jgi:hypothetical protein
VKAGAEVYGQGCPGLGPPSGLESQGSLESAGVRVANGLATTDLEGARSRIDLAVDSEGRGLENSIATPLDDGGYQNEFPSPWAKDADRFVLEQQSPRKLQSAELAIVSCRFGSLECG